VLIVRGAEHDARAPQKEKKQQQQQQQMPQ
jgi:hypothetical protein